MNSQKYVIHSGNTHPLQFSLGKIVTVSAITDSIGQGWDRTRDLKYFNKSNNSEIEQQEVPMTTSHQFEEAHFMLSMMKQIKFTLSQLNGRLFTIESFMPIYEPPKTSC
jgi:hypothetical protein